MTRHHFTSKSAHLLLSGVFPVRAVDVGFNPSVEVSKSSEAKAVFTLVSIMMGVVLSFWPLMLVLAANAAYSERTVSYVVMTTCARLRTSASVVHCIRAKNGNAGQRQEIESAGTEILQRLSGRIAANQEFLGLPRLAGVCRSPRCSA